MFLLCAYAPAPEALLRVVSFRWLISERLHSSRSLAREEAALTHRGQHGVRRDSPTSHYGSSRGCVCEWVCMCKWNIEWLNINIKLQQSGVYAAEKERMRSCSVRWSRFRCRKRLVEIFLSSSRWWVRNFLIAGHFSTEPTTATCFVGKTDAGGWVSTYFYGFVIPRRFKQCNAVSVFSYFFFGVLKSFHGVFSTYTRNLFVEKHMKNNCVALK